MSDATPVPSLEPALDATLQFGVAMLEAGATAADVEVAMARLGRRCGPFVITSLISTDAVVATLSDGQSGVTLVRRLRGDGVNAQQMSRLERFARASDPIGSSDILLSLAKPTDAAPSMLSLVSVVGLACAAFAYLSRGDGADVLAAGIGGALGQGARSIMGRYGSYASAGAAALVAPAGAAAVATFCVQTGLGDRETAVALVSSVLFLVPGYPLVAGLLDLFARQRLAAATRFAHGAALMFVAAFGLSLITSLGRFDLAVDSTSSSPGMLGRLCASFLAAGALAVLFHSPLRTALAVGLLAGCANAVRFLILDAAAPASLAAFLAALLIGYGAAVIARVLDQSRITIAVPAIIIMIPGLYIFQTLVFFHQARIIDALEAAASGSFVLGSMAMGLVTARLISSSETSAGAP